MSDDGADETNEESDGSSPGFAVSGSDPVSAVRDLATTHPFISQLGIEPQAFEDGVFRATVAHDEQFTNPMPNAPLAGGFLTSVLDAVMGFTVQAATFDDETVASGPTTNLNVNFLDAATGDVRAEGEVVRLGGSSAVVDGRLRDEQSGDLVATAQGTWRLYRSD